MLELGTLRRMTVPKKSSESRSTEKLTCITASIQSKHFKFKLGEQSISLRFGT
jgi:hypothetical protein